MAVSEAGSSGLHEVLGSIMILGRDFPRAETPELLDHLILEYFREAEGQGEVNWGEADPVGQTPLMCVAQNGLVQCLEFLCGKGVNLEARDPQGRSAKELATLTGEVACATLLGQKVDEQKTRALSEALPSAGFTSPGSFVGAGGSIYNSDGEVDGKVNAFDPYGWY